MIQPRVADSGKGDVAASMTARSQQSSAILQGPERAWLVSHNSGWARFRGRFPCAIPATTRSRANDLNEIACAPRLGHEWDVARDILPAHIPGGEDDPEIGRRRRAACANSGPLMPGMRTSANRTWISGRASRIFSAPWPL